MATRGETAKAEAQRKGPKPKKVRREGARVTHAEKIAEPHLSTRAGKKATYALESPSASGRHSRKSTRSGGNRVKPDAQLNAREEMQKGSPTARFRKASAKASRVRGHSSPRA